MSEALRRDRSIGVWLLACAAMVYALVILGGITRLTRSGLSITEWRPVTGILPPLTHAAWLEAFERYRATPEYRLVNTGMTLDAFRGIFLVEYAHRLLARSAGAVFLGPLVWFAAKRRLGRRLRRVLAIAALGLLQGAIGWWMVWSGLIASPHVSHYRLAIHLLMALTLFLLLLWSALDEFEAPDSRLLAVRSTWSVRSAVALLAVSLVTVFWGALMAGLHAGYVCNTFPTMNGAWIPPGLGALGLHAADPFANPVSVHFIHRLLALLTTLCALGALYSVWKSGLGDSHAKLCFAMLGSLAVQVALGAWTVLASVPISAASLHQANAVLVLACECALLHALVHATRFRFVDEPGQSESLVAHERA